MALIPHSSAFPIALPSLLLVADNLLSPLPFLAQPCLASGLLGTVLSDVFSEEVTLVGGLILAAVGIYNLMGETTRINSRKSAYGQSLFVGIAVGLDGAVATLSLTMMGYSPILVAAIVTGAHALSVLAGISLSENVKLLKIRRIKALAPILLIALGIYKILSVFI